MYDSKSVKKENNKIKSEFTSVFDSIAGRQSKKAKVLSLRRGDVLTKRNIAKGKDSKGEEYAALAERVQEIENDLDDAQRIEESDINASEAARKKGNGIDFKSILFAKKSKIGRHGAKQLSESRDSIKLLDDKGAPPKAYFDPFGKIIWESEKDDKRGSLRKALNRDFLKRVEAQKKLAKKNDFEKSRYGDVDKEKVILDMILEEAGDNASNLKFDQVSDTYKDQVASKYAAAFDNTREFQKDFGEGDKKLPDNFEVVVSVDPPTDIYIDYNKDVTKSTPTILKKFRGRPDHYNILERNIRSSRDYAEIVEKGRKDAEAAGLHYDPEKDPNVAVLQAQIASSMGAGQGHSFVRMVALKGNSAVHGYSFGFWPMTTTPGIGSVTMGQVKNPDPEVGNASVIERKTRISYSNYLRAASKIRGIVGSQRTYSFLGYNCTSFAADIAKEAGAPIGKEDSGEYMMTFRSRKALIDSPYSLAKYVRAANPGKRDSGEQAVREWESLSFSEQYDAVSLGEMKKGLEKRIKKREQAEVLPTLASGNETALSYKKNESGGTDEYEVTYAGDRFLRGEGSKNVKNVSKVLKGRLLRDAVKRMVANPVFEERYLAENSSASREEFAETIVMSLVQVAKMVVDETEADYNKNMSEVSGERHSGEGDPIERMRDRLIKERRSEIKRRLGADSGMGFVMQACSSGEALRTAFEKMELANAESKQRKENGELGKTIRLSNEGLNTVANQQANAAIEAIVQNAGNVKSSEDAEALEILKHAMSKNAKLKMRIANAAMLFTESVPFICTMLLELVGVDENIAERMDGIKKAELVVAATEFLVGEEAEEIVEQLNENGPPLVAREPLIDMRGIIAKNGLTDKDKFKRVLIIGGIIPKE